MSERASTFDRWLAAEKAKLQAEGWSLHEPLDPEMAHGVDTWLWVRVKRSRVANNRSDGERKGQREGEVPGGA